MSNKNQKGLEAKLSSSYDKIKDQKAKIQEL